MHVLVQSAILILSLFVLAKSADLVVRNIVKIANYLGWSTFVVSFLVLGVASSTPEIFVGINSLINDTPQLSLGNVMGASIVLLSLITGLTAYFSGKVKIEKNFAKSELVAMSILILLPILLLFDGELTRIDSIIMLVCYGLYVLKIYKDRHSLPHPISFNHKTKISKTVMLFLLGLLGLGISSNYAVTSALTLAEAFELPALLIGILLFSVGTNFPEVIVALTAIKNKQKTVVIGNVMGSATTNTLVLSLISFVKPFSINDKQVFFVSVIFLVTIVLAFSMFTSSKNEISKREGLILLILYFLFVFTELVTKLI